MAELLAANQITIAKVSDGADGEMSAEQIAQLNQASSDASEAKTDASTAKTTAQTANSTAQVAQSSASQAQTKAQQALEASSVTTETLKAESARIDNLETGKANIADLNAEKARIDTLETNKADIDLANVNNAWITNGVIKDASIANEKVISVSANKLTAGTIDASKITVTNLNADNITVGTINGARIGDNSIDLDKLSQEVPTKEYLDSVEQKLQEEIDGAIETFTVSEIPTLNNEPAVNWTTDDIKSTHVGDLCYVVNNASDNDGFCYRFQYNGTAYSWALIKDNDVTKAIQDIAELGGEVTQFKSDYTSKISEIDGGIESLKSRTTTIETTYPTKAYVDTSVSSKVETSVFNTLKNTVDENSANITSLTETVATKADNSTVTTLSNTVNEVKQTADANSSSISSLTTTVNNKADGSKVTELETKTSTIEQNLSGVTTRVSSLESESDGLDTRLTAAESKITDDAIVSTVTSSKTYKDALSGKVDTSVYNTKMQQLDNSISLKATATDVYTKTQADAAFDAKGSAATAKSEAISSAKSYTDTATTDMATEEFVTSQGYLTVTSDAITSKVSKNEVISAINQTAESVSINANKINLNGSVTFSSFDNSLQTTINNKAETSDLEGVRTIANNAQAEIDNLEIGGRNLLIGSEIGVVNTRADTSSHADIKFQAYNGGTPVGQEFSFGVTAGEHIEYTYTSKYSGNNIRIGDNGLVYDAANNFLVPEYKEGVVYTFSCDVIDDRPNVVGGYVLKNIKLEKGNKATDWTPAPEDIDEGIANAAKVATNFMEYDSTNGLIVGNKTSGSWSGYRSQILPGSFNVLDASSTVLASFGPTTVIGEEAKANLHLTFNNLSMVDANGTEFFKVGDNRNADGTTTIKHTGKVTVSSAGSATVTVNSYISSIVSVYADSVELSSSNYSFSEKNVTINGLTANSEKTIEITYTTTESTVYLTFGERDSSGNIGNYSVAAGSVTTASGFASHAEGHGTTASGLNSHAEGYKTTASGLDSHAEGYMTTASGSYSHAGGHVTVADGDYMTAIGQYNTRNSNKAFVIGNGAHTIDRSDAFAVDWDGNIYMSLGGCTIIDSGTTLSVTRGASTLDGLVAQAIINTFSYANAKEILDMPGDVNMNVKKLLQKIVEKIG